MDEHIEAVQKMQDHIAANLDETIARADLAWVSQYSPWFSYRLFSVLLRMTPAVYIRRLRLSQSALRLRDEKVKIIDVAFDFGFESVDGYQRAFFKEFGCNPYEYSISPTPIYLFKPYGVKYAKRKEKMCEVKSVLCKSSRSPKEMSLSSVEKPPSIILNIARRWDATYGGFFAVSNLSAESPFVFGFRHNTFLWARLNMCRASRYLPTIPVKSPTALT